MERPLVKCVSTSSSELSYCGGPEARARSQTCGTMTGSLTRWALPARPLIPILKDVGLGKGDQCFCDGVLQPRRATIATRLDPTGLTMRLTRRMA